VNASRRYIYIVPLLCVLQVFSPVLVVPGLEDFGVTVFRAVLLAISAIMFVYLGFSQVSQSSRFAMMCGALLAIWMLISLIWSDIPTVGVRQISYIATLLLTIYALDVCIQNENQYIFILKFISVLGLFILILSIYEISTGNHFFRSSLQDASELDASLSYISDNQAWFTFGNPNDLAVHIVFCCFCSAIAIKNLVLKTLYLSFSAYVIYLLDARLVLISLAAFLALILLFSLRNSLQWWMQIVFAFAVAAASIFVLAISFGGTIEYADVSIFIRLKLVESALDMAGHSLLVGIGSGGFELEMWARAFVADTFGITSPHNAMARIFAENGILGLGLFLMILFGPISVIRKVSLPTRTAPLVLGAVLAMPLLFSVGSDPLSSSSLQLAIALCWIGARFSASFISASSGHLAPAAGASIGRQGT
jgi:O-antigen ligase